MVEKRYYWFAGAFLVIILTVVLATNIASPSSRHTLRFGRFEGGSMKYYIADGDVYINSIYAGKTTNGLLSIKDCIPGQVEFVPSMSIKLKENDKPKFDLSCNSFIHDFSLVKQEKIISELGVASDFIPYLAYDNELVRKNAVELTRDCPVNNNACMTNKIFNAVVANIKYVADARDIEHVQSVPKTLNIKAADCEDFTVLLSTYLESVGIKTMMLLTNSHIYMLACNLKYEDVKSIVPAGKQFFWYDINNERCFVIDPTIPDSYMGYSANVLGEKIAVDPVTKDYYILDRQSSQ